MLTSAECEAHAKEKLAAADGDLQHRRRLLTAAEAWLHLADLVRCDPPLTKGEIIAKVRSKKRR